MCLVDREFSDPAIDPGGRIEPPGLSSSPLLDLQLLTRYNLYLPDEAAGAAIVNAPVGHTVRALMRL